MYVEIRPGNLIEEGMGNRRSFNENFNCIRIITELNGWLRRIELPPL